MEQSGSKNPGTPLSAVALIISILALLGTPVIFFIATGWASFEDGRGNALALTIGWMFVCSLSVMFGMLGRKRSKAALHKATLGAVAMIIGLLAELLCVGIVYAIFQVDSF